jgi:centrin-1
MPPKQAASPARKAP